MIDPSSGHIPSLEWATWDYDSTSLPEEYHTEPEKTRELLDYFKGKTFLTLGGFVTDNTIILERTLLAWGLFYRDVTKLRDQEASDAPLPPPLCDSLVFPDAAIKALNEAVERMYNAIPTPDLENSFDPFDQPPMDGPSGQIGVTSTPPRSNVSPRPAPNPKPWELPLPDLDFSLGFGRRVQPIPPQPHNSSTSSPSRGDRTSNTAEPSAGTSSRPRIVTVPKVVSPAKVADNAAPGTPRTFSRPKPRPVRGLISTGIRPTPPPPMSPRHTDTGHRELSVETSHARSITGVPSMGAAGSSSRPANAPPNRLSSRNVQPQPVHRDSPERTATPARLRRVVSAPAERQSNLLQNRRKDLRALQQQTSPVPSGSRKRSAADLDGENEGVATAQKVVNGYILSFRTRTY